MSFKKILIAFFLILLSQTSFAIKKPVIPLQASTCITATFSNTGDQWWKTIKLVLKNQCGTSVDFQNASITFLNKTKLSTTFWGTFAPLGYPDNTEISSQFQPTGNYLATLVLHFPNDANTILKNNQYITIIYGNRTSDYIANSVKVNLGNPAKTGEIDLTNSSAKPENVSQDYALVHLTYNGQSLSDVQVPWSGTIQLKNLVEGNYGISPVNVKDNAGLAWQGTANPASINLTAGDTVTSTISYSLVALNGKISFDTKQLPAELTGYNNNPAIVLTNSANGSAINATVNWNAVTTVSSLLSGANYNFSSSPITYNGYKCNPAFDPVSATADTTAPVVNLSYTCTQIPVDNISVNVTGLPDSVTSITTTFTPNDGTTPVNKDIAITNGQGSSTVGLTDKVTYTISSSSVNGYTATYNPQPLIATANATENITYSAAPAVKGRIIGYLPGWKTPPSATELANAGYTHMLVAFGVFSTTKPGEITPAFETVSASYIKSLQNAGIKVVLSLGGALTSIPNTTVNFHDALTAAQSPDVFTQTFIQSLENLMTQYGFDGFDIDIEHGINGGGTFTNPQGDIAVLANIINTMHAKHPSLLLTLAPQTANISATRDFNAIWGNYASLIMQTYNSLEWVGIQLYNTGCMNGIDNVCHDPNATNTPDFSVAMATDLLENWPTSFGFQPYISHLKPSQVVLGYPAPNASGGSDGAPVTPVSTIKRALQCLRTATANGSLSCGSYVAPKAYPGIGGVFEWEITYDQNNNYQFAKGLRDCVMNGNCQ